MINYIGPDFDELSLDTAQRPVLYTGAHLRFWIDRSTGRAAEGRDYDQEGQAERRAQHHRLDSSHSLAGAFRNHINVHNAIVIGLLPDLEEKVVKIGNGASADAAQMLMSQKIRRDSEAWATRIKYTKRNEREPEFDLIAASNIYLLVNHASRMDPSNKLD